jgi:hypothetical protein
MSFRALTGGTPPDTVERAVTAGVVVDDERAVRLEHEQANRL